MVLKTFNVEDLVYKKFSDFCKSHGISMSKQIQLFMKSFIAEEPEAKKEYLAKLNVIRNGRFLKINNFAERYGL
jgi:hypothetical protein